ncbi:choline dehydrogenase-like flavoprotein [Actinomycetospora succinea]|uniref:Choline dehydrogenase-like flavoprotein n=2 Tax=Actinomycetospora succinea TaxID=663603 RepID=A0A4R6VMK3_9PSEU|nr:choline dehydrogenase-like flavoprotein [Actinomycetospora succinea]
MVSGGEETIPEERSFDYVVVGAGPAGLACARRLCDYMPSARVALVEAGGSGEDLYPALDMPMMFTSQHFTENDWRYFTTPQAGASGRSIYLPRGKVLGGTSTGNATLLNRGCAEDWDDLGEKNPGWSWSQVLPFFKNVETFHPSGLAFESAVHGQSGPLAFGHPDPAGISHKVVEGFESKGMPRVTDFFSAGAAHGCDHVPRSVHEGVRTHAGHYLSEGGWPRNLTVFYRCQVLRARIEDGPDGAKVCSGVDVHHTRTTRHFSLDATAEVVISSGAYNSPVVLMHSGIGPQGELDQHQIPVNSRVEGVGRNLIDHLMVWSFYEISDPELTNDHGFRPENHAEAEQQWHDSRSGPMASVLIGPMAYMRLDARQREEIVEWHTAGQSDGGREGDPTGAPPGAPHLEFFGTEAYGGYEEQLDTPGPGQAAISLTTLLLHQRSRGSVTLSSFHPLAPPTIDHAYLSDPLDVALLAWGCRFAHDIMTTGAGTSEVTAGPWPRDVAKPDTVDEWKQFVRDNATTCYHPSGTCKMGPADDPTAVVDARLRVYGVRGLRVADLSVLPRLPAGHPQHAVYMIGEKAAHLIAEDAGVEVLPVGG